MRLLTVLATVAGVHAFDIRCRQVRNSDRVVAFEFSDGPIIYFKSETKLQEVPPEVERILTLYPAGVLQGIKIVGETDYYLFDAMIGEAFEFPSPGLWCGAGKRQYIPGMYYHGRKKTRWIHELNEMMAFVEEGNCEAMLNNGVAHAEDYNDRCNQAYGVFYDARVRLIFESPDDEDPFSEWDMDECRREFRALKREGAVKHAIHKTISLEKIEELLQQRIKREQDALNLEVKDSLASKLRKEKHLRKQDGNVPPAHGNDYVQKNSTAKYLAQLMELEEMLKKDLENHKPAPRGAILSLAAIMLAIWGLYYKSTSLVALNLLSCVIIPNTFFAFAEIFREHISTIIIVLDFEVTVGRVEWMRQFSTGYGITHSVKQEGMLSVVIRVFRVLTYTSAAAGYIYLRLLPYASKIPTSLFITFAVVLMTMRLFCLAMGLILRFYEFTVWYYLWRGINNRSTIVKAYWHFILTIVLVAIGMWPENVSITFQRKMKEVPPSLFELAGALFGCALPFLWFYQWWGRYELVHHESPLPEDEERMQNPETSFHTVHESATKDVTGGLDEKPVLLVFDSVE